MRKLLITSLLLAAACLTAGAQLLYRISGGGLEHPSYIFGTHHIAPLSIVDSIAGFDSAFASCSQLYGEIEMDSANTPAAQQMMMQAMMAPADSALTALFTPAEFALIDSAVRLYLGVGAEQLAVLKPAALSTQLSVAQTLKVFPGFSQAEQLDIYLQRRAAERGMPVRGLESLASQIDVLFGAPLREQADELLELVTMERADELARRMADAYMAQDAAELYRLMTDPEWGGNEAELERILFGRNEAWVAKMPAIMEAQPSFFVVGAGHLPGSRGVLSLLGQRGYKVEPVK
ncbi:MAG: TraB/GumN family protein [bacterium]|uniref:TraB/GumN family protein n=1 Tax=Candidatus Aphodosoma intestinipullorum TaxID=2840674 RepID=A0A940IEJ7_9BACT|nr:TraB/GumN family protein [Candidatus Aphodosoma intestinipullorum]